MTSLRDSAIWVSVTKTELLPHAKSGQTFIDFGTTVVHQTQQLAEALITKEATLLDVPVSGGPVGIRNGNCICLQVAVVRSLIDVCHYCR